MNRGCPGREGHRVGGAGELGERGLEFADDPRGVPVGQRPVKLAAYSLLKALIDGWPVVVRTREADRFRAAVRGERVHDAGLLSAANMGSGRGGAVLSAVIRGAIVAAVCSAEHSRSRSTT